MGIMNHRSITYTGIIIVSVVCVVAFRQQQSRRQKGIIESCVCICPGCVHARVQCTLVLCSIGRTMWAGFALLVLGMLLVSRSGAFRLQGSSNLRHVAVTRFASKLRMAKGEKEGKGAGKMSPVRVRFAPSPTGSLHVGGARTALFNWLLAKKTKGTFIIRVEDTDEARSTRASEESILADLKWMNMSWDEGPEIGGPHAPYRQSERKDIYKKFAEQLIADGKAYRCFCTEEELDKKREEAEAAGVDPKYDGTWANADPAEVQKKLDNNELYTVRFRVPPGKVVSIDDIVRGRVTWDADASLGDFIVLRSNGMPVYNFCVAVDDANMQITHVIRAEEHLTNTLRQMLILEGLGFKPPTYAHCSLILGSDRSKLSKRHGATSVMQFSQQGFLPEAMMNYLANLGFNDGTPKEIYTPDELVAAFDLSRIIKNPAQFDMNKLRWINGQHLRKIPAEKIQALVGDTLANKDGAAADGAIIDASHPDTRPFVVQATKIAQKDMELVVDARRLVGNCLKYDIQAAFQTDEHTCEVFEDDSGSFEAIVKALIRDYESGAMPTGTEPTFSALWKEYLNNLGAELNLKGKSLFHPVRLALTGRMSGPDVGEQVALVAAAQNCVASSSPYQLVLIKERMAILKTLNFAGAKVPLNPIP